MLEIALEILVVAVVVGLQIRTFLQTRTKTRQLSLLYPPREALRVEQRLVLPDGRDLPDYAADAPPEAYRPRCSRPITPRPSSRKSCSIPTTTCATTRARRPISGF